MRKPTKKTSPDKLIKTSKKGDIQVAEEELTEEELKKVAGGTYKQMKFQDLGAFACFDFK